MQQIVLKKLATVRGMQCTLLPPTWAKSLTKFNSKMQDFKRALDLNSKQKKG